MGRLEQGALALLALRLAEEAPAQRRERRLVHPARLRECGGGGSDGRASQRTAARGDTRHLLVRDRGRDGHGALAGGGDAPGEVRASWMVLSTSGVRGARQM